MAASVNLCNCLKKQQNRDIGYIYCVVLGMYRELKEVEFPKEYCNEFGNKIKRQTKK
jgi:hypothetical protein